MSTSHEFLQELCVEWQRKLRLLDWKVTIRYSQPDEIDCRGLINTFPNLKAADIIILDVTSDTAKKFAFTTRRRLTHTVVHELLHLHFAVFKHLTLQPLYNTMEEQTVECISQALTADIPDDPIPGCTS